MSFSINILGGTFPAIQQGLQPTYSQPTYSQPTYSIEQHGHDTMLEITDHLIADNELCKILDEHPEITYANLSGYPNLTPEAVTRLTQMPNITPKSFNFLLSSPHLCNHCLHVGGKYIPTHTAFLARFGQGLESQIMNTSNTTVFPGWPDAAEICLAYLHGIDDLTQISSVEFLQIIKNQAGLFGIINLQTLCDQRIAELRERAPRSPARNSDNLVIVQA